MEFNGSMTIFPDVSFGYPTNPDDQTFTRTLRHVKSSARTCDIKGHPDITLRFAPLSAFCPRTYSYRPAFQCDDPQPFEQPARILASREIFFQHSHQLYVTIKLSDSR